MHVLFRVITVFVVIKNMIEKQTKIDIIFLIIKPPNFDKYFRFYLKIQSNIGVYLLLLFFKFNNLWQ